MASAINFMMLNSAFSLKQFDFLSELARAAPDKRVWLLFVCLEALGLVLIWMCSDTMCKSYHNEMQKITPGIITPAPSGENLHGSARWLSKKKFPKDVAKCKLRLTRNVRKLMRYGYRDLHFYMRNYLFHNAEIERLYVDTTDGLFRGHLLIGRYKATESFSHRFIATKHFTLVFGSRLTENHRISVPDISIVTAKFAASDIRIDRPLLKAGGFALGSEQDGNTQIFYCIKSDIHSLTIGGTRSGKTRYDVIQTICLLALAGESIIIIDVKGELHLSCTQLLKRLGYSVGVLDFVEPEKSDRHNFLKPVIDHLQKGETSKAQDATWDIVSTLVGEAKGEKIWNNGECSVIAFAVFCVCWECMSKPEYQNMTNVYYFIAEMCRATEEGVLPIVKYAKSLPDSHPAKGLIRISEVAPQRTRGSFFTSALSTLRLFTNDAVSAMTSGQTLEFDSVGDKKCATFLVLPDEKTTYNSIATLFISQQYQRLVNRARENGNRLPIRVNFIEDEKGNFPAIVDYDTAITAGGGRGIRFNMFLQSFSQLYDKYGKEKAKTIIHNCEVWNCLHCSDEDTIREFQTRMGTYTVKSQSGNSSANYSGLNGSVSSSYNYMSRKLLENDEFSKIARPYQLIVFRKDPAMMKALPLEDTYFNAMMGLGDEEFNRRVIQERNARRAVFKPQRASLWGIWKEYQEEDEEEEQKPTKSKTMNHYIEQARANGNDDYPTCATVEEFNDD